MFASFDTRRTHFIEQNLLIGTIHLSHILIHIKTYVNGKKTSKNKRFPMGKVFAFA